MRPWKVLQTEMKMDVPGVSWENVSIDDVPWYGPVGVVLLGYTSRDECRVHSHR